MHFLIAVLQLQLAVGGGPAVAQVPTTASSADYSLEAGVIPVDRSEYTLDAGDRVMVTIEGGVSEYLLSVGVMPVETRVVTLDGYINMSGIGSIHVGGLSIDEAQLALDASIRRQFPSLRARLTLQLPRVVNVDLRGMVVSPGRYPVYATKTVAELIQTSGGLRIYGSQYGHAITHSGDTLTVDLSTDPVTSRFRSNPFLGNVHVVEVYPSAHPAFVNKMGVVSTYDVGQNGVSLTQLVRELAVISGNIDLPGSYISTGDNRMITLWNETTGFADHLVMPFDTLNLVPHESAVFVGGAVRTPGMVSFRPGATADWYIQAAGGFQENASRQNIIISSSTGILENVNTESYIIRPNSTIEVEYSWLTRNSDYISLALTVATLTITVMNFMK